MNNYPMHIKTDIKEATNLDKLLTFEWIITNGLGGYASQSVLGVNTRKYHGILVAAFNPPVNRRVILSKIDEKVLIGREVYNLGINEYDNGLKLEECKHLENFSRFPFPQYIYNIHNIKVQKTILMPSQKNVTIISYNIHQKLDEEITLQITPLMNSRHFHSVTTLQNRPRFAYEAFPQKIILQTNNPKTTSIISSNLGKFIPEEKWFERLFYRVDSSLGTSCFDDCFSPGMFEVNIKPDQVASFQIITASGKENTLATHDSIYHACGDFSSFFKVEIKKLNTLSAKFTDIHPFATTEVWLKWLLFAADQFIVTRFSTGKKSVIAGYHWFEDWGRDSLISIPGLTLALGRFNDAREILLTFNHYCRKGVIPNRFPDEDANKPIYNTVDATLWFVNAVLQYLKYTGDFEFVKENLWTTLQSVIEHHIQGTINKIKLDNDGLIMHGPQLTWMDATREGIPITPREGKAVEIQALWFNALRTMELIADHLGEKDYSQEYKTRAEIAKKSFREKFWNSQKNYLYDVVMNEKKDDSLRPNQIFAIALDFSMLSLEEQSAIVDIMQDKLWAKFGLRTLSPNHPNYKGKYAGDWNERNYAYHNGTAWSWLVGPFVLSYLKVRNFNPDAREFAFKNFLYPLIYTQTFQAGLGTLSEIFDGDPPHLPRGCISQAWSVAEILRAYIESILLYSPPFENFVLGESFNG
jgi:predicted glycogen debranching enzyme